MDWTGGPERGRFSWDLINTFVAVRGVHGTYFKENQYSAVNVDEEGHENFIKGAGNISMIIFANLDSANKVGNAIDDLLCRKPNSRPAP